ncbi:MAG: hypothetical protein ACRD6W_00840, partial [Nitrososphaerales archaeon]
LEITYPGKVEAEPDYNDIRLDLGKRRVIVEVKSDPRARYAIREALGQLLEYAFVSQAKGWPATEIVVAAPGEADGQVQEYLRYLCETRGLPIRYVPFRNETESVDL